MPVAGLIDMALTKRDTHAPAARSSTHFQREAHELLVEEGFEFHRRTAKSANVYTHPDGRRISVNATPRNEGNAINYIKQSLKSPRLGLSAGQSPAPTPPKEEPVPTTTSSIDALLTMAGPDVRKPPSGPLNSPARQARNDAFREWVRRVLTEHGPLDSRLLAEAAEEIGFKNHHLTRARQEIGVLAYMVAGEGAGRGKGQATVWAALPYQVPEGASVLGGQTKKRSLPEHPIGENNGAGPEPREERPPMPEGQVEPFEPGSLDNPTPAQRQVMEHAGLLRVAPELEEVEPDLSPLSAEEQAAVALGGIIRDVPDDPRGPHEPGCAIDPFHTGPCMTLTPDEPEGVPGTAWSDEIPFRPEPGSADVLAAATLLLDTLGLKTAHPRLGEGLSDLDEFLSDLAWRVDKAREKVATLRGLLS